MLRILDRDVIDKNGIAGVFDIRMQLTAADLFHGLSFRPEGPPADTWLEPRYSRWCRSWG
jgi:hypothetical protein